MSDDYFRMNMAHYRVPAYPTGSVDYNALYKHGERLYLLVTTDNASKQYRAALQDAVTVNSDLMQPLLAYFGLPSLDALRYAMEADTLSRREYESLKKFRRELPEIYEVMEREYLRFEPVLSPKSKEKQL